MAKEVVKFIATKYKNKPVKISFYTKTGEEVNFRATHKVASKVVVKFQSKKK